ncbi:hypothetical protein NUU61_005820 [Penicillium alfredii]|uniref:Glycosyltransferase family 8 protein n=1 Tax=Penicillium alfredii TaxID=1506179 RepID=A0A9W9K7Y0_9EURO|nr:uncharacterized protein NUU61_005820 [Penicillium alfredii]KAJ5096464.1 hypothetical protein NUU61_005820 [Penicillium alfredii]
MPGRKSTFFLVLATSLTFFLVVSWTLSGPRSDATFQKHADSSTAHQNDTISSAHLKPHSNPTPSPVKTPYAIGTFVGTDTYGTEDAGDDEDRYYVGARTLVYQLLHAPSTKLTSPVSIVILVTKGVRESKRKRLRDDGATVIEVEDVPHNITVGQPRWAETFAKVRLFDPKIMPYRKVLLMDTDMVITRPIDAIFEDPSSEPMNSRKNQTNRADLPLATLPEKFAIAAAPESLDRDHPYPFVDHDHTKGYFNSGLVLYTPSTELFQHYLEIIARPDLFYNGFPDQDLLNYAHRWQGPMPWRRLHFSWYLNWPNQDDIDGGMAIIHSKFWEPDLPFGPGERLALSRRWEMQGYWMGKGGSRLFNDLVKLVLLLVYTPSLLMFLMVIPQVPYAYSV